MLNENDVIAIVTTYLEGTGWTIIRLTNTRQTGPDLEAVNPLFASRLYVEAKGATSAGPTSSRYGDPFSRSQVRDHVANAFYVAAGVPTEHTSAIAVPTNRLHEHFMETIRPALSMLKIAVLWLAESGLAGTWHGPQTDRPTANRRIGAADPHRYSLEAVLVPSAACDPVPAILRCSFTHEPIFG